MLKKNLHCGSELKQLGEVSMNNFLQLTIHGQTPAQKNSKQFARLRDGRTILVSNKIVQAWQKEAAKELALLYQRDTFTERVRISYMFFVKDNRGRDIDNMIASVNDALVKAGVLLDDKWQLLAIGSADAQLDKDNPRAEIVIEKYGL